MRSLIRSLAVAVSLLVVLPAFEEGALASPTQVGQMDEKGTQGKAKTSESASKGASKKKAASGSKKSESGKKAKSGRSKIEKTGIASIDSVFTQVAAIDSTLAGVESSLRSGKVNLNTALALEKGTPIEDAIASLQKTAGNKLTVVQKGKMPQLAVTDAVPANVQQAVDGLNGLLNDLTSSVDDLRAMPAQVQALVNESKSLPKKLQNEFQGDLLGSLFAMPKAMSALNTDIAILTGLPARVTSVTSRSTEIIGLVSSTFAPSR